MFKLILVFGVWINPMQVEKMKQRYDDCNVYMVESWVSIKDKTCAQVAKEINKQMESK